MPIVQHNHVRQYETSYRHEFPGSQVAEHAVKVWMHEDTLESDTIFVVHPPFATAPSTMRRMTEKLGHLPLAIVEMPFPDPRPEGIKATIGAGSAAVRQRIQEARGKDTAFWVAGYSLGAGVALQEVEKYKGLVMVAPFGLTNEPLDDLEDEPLANEIIGRRTGIMRNVIQNKRRLRYTEDPGEMAGPPPLDEPRINREELTMRMNWAVVQDGPAMLEQWVESAESAGVPRYTVVAPVVEDPIFKLEKIHQHVGHLIGREGFKFIPLEGGHLPWTAARSGEQFGAAIEQALMLPNFAERVAA